MTINTTILDGCLRNDRGAQHTLYKLCYPALMQVCMRYERNKEDAEAILNLSFYKILKNIHKYHESIPFEAWIKRITLNTVIDEFRKKNKDKHAFMEKLEDALPLSSMSYNEAALQFDAEDILAMIQELPPVSQKVFNLYLIEGYSHKEIGEMLGISEGTSKWHLSSARKSLKEKLLPVLNRVAGFVI